MSLRLTWPDRRARILGVLFLAIFVSGVLVYLNVLLAENLDIVPFLLAGYLAVELIVPRVMRGKENHRDAGN